MDPLVVGELILAACALKGGNKNGGKRGGHHSSSKDDPLAWQHDHSDLGI